MRENPFHAPVLASSGFLEIFGVLGLMTTQLQSLRGIAPVCVSLSVSKFLLFLRKP